MGKVYRIYYSNNIINKEIFYDSKTDLVYSLKDYDKDGILLKKIIWNNKKRKLQSFLINLPTSDSFKEDGAIQILSREDIRLAEQERLKIEEMDRQNAANTYAVLIERYTGSRINDNTSF